MPYSLIDKSIDDWASNHSLSIFREWNGQDNRFVYLTNDNQETIQIAIDEPDNEEVVISLNLIEGSDDIEFSAIIKASIGDIDNALRSAVALARFGIRR